MTTELSHHTLSNPPLIPKGRIGRFIYESEIGQGSVGIVYLFRDPMIGRKVAIKVLNPQLPASERQLFEKHFIQEARAAGRLNHPNIVTVYDADKSGDLLFIVMEYLHGQELRSQLAKGQQFTYKQIADMIGRIASALDYAHDNGVIHRDIKPANIFITDKGVPKVLDFGIASASRQITDPDATLGLEKLTENRLMGTPNYMSPEQARGDKMDARSDIFSLGVVMYQLLCGQLPFRAKNIEGLLQAIIKEPAIPPHEIKNDVPLRLARIAAKALAKKPEDRYERASEMARELNRYLEKERTERIIAKIQNPDEKGSKGLVSNGVANPVSTKPTKSPLVIGAGALTVAALIAGVAYKVYDPSTKPVVQIATANTTPPLPNPVQVAPKPSIAAPNYEASASQVAPTSVASVAVTTEKSKEEKTASKPVVSSKTKTVNASTISKNDANAATMGSVQIAVSPWGEVFVDGQSKGVAPPLTRLSLSIGKHRIEIKNGDESHATSIEIVADKEAKISHRF